MSVLATNSNYLIESAVPTGREEAWRFTPLNRLAGLHDGTAKIVNRKSLALKGAMQPGVNVSRIPRDVVSQVSETDDVIVTRIHAEVEEVFVLDIAENTHLSEAIHLHRVAGGIDGAELSQVRINIGANSTASVIVENTGSAILGEDVEIVLAPGAHLTFVTLQEWANDSVHAARHHAILDRDSTFESITVTVGGSLVRLLPTVEFSGPGSFAELFGVYFATAGQHLEHRIHIDHGVPHAKSRVNYKGALSGSAAHTVWIGDVFIRAAAEGTDTYELNRNLLLSDGARADSVPNLEIETGEIIGAGHASTTGRFDDEQLFYLMSRGIPMDEARRLVVRGFFAEIISHIEDEEIQERLMGRIDGELEKVGH
jgi:Fe-S cluster assembly protein SufD